MKKVSIVLPIYNGADYMRDAIESCLEQTYRNIELVIVDDCSTDETPIILEAYKRHPKVNIIRHEVNAKLPAALNTGFAHTTGDYLTWTSDDNLFAPTAIEKMVKYLNDHLGIRFVYTDYYLIDEAGEQIRLVSAGPPSHLEKRCAITSFLYRREVYETVGDYETDLFRVEDYDYWLRVNEKFKIAWYPKALYYYRRHASSLTGTDHLENRADMFDQVNTRFFGPDPGRKQRVLTNFYIAEAFESHLRAERLNVLRFTGRAVRNRPSLLKNKGVISISLQAILGKTIMAGIRWMLKPITNLVFKFD